MNILYVISLLILMIIGVFQVLKSKYTLGFSLILISILFYGILNKTTTKEIITVACSPDYKPFCYLKNGNITGIDIILIEEVGKKLNKKIELKNMSFSFLFEEIKQAKSHIAVGGLAINEERKKYLNFSIPYLTNKGACGILTKKEIILNKDFDGVIGIQIGTNSFKEIIKEKFPKAKIIEVEDFMVLLESFKNNIDNINVVIGDTIVLIDFLDHQKYTDHFYKLYKTDMPNLIGTGFILSNNINIEEFNKILEEIIKNNKELKIIKEKIEKIEDLN